MSAITLFRACLASRIVEAVGKRIVSATVVRRLLDYSRLGAEYSRLRCYDMPSELCIPKRRHYFFRKELQ